MILSVSERCDVIALYSEWFFNRIKAGFVDVRNPFNHKQVSRIEITPEFIKAIVFCTKDPRPMHDRLDELKQYKYIVQITITPYQRDIEPAIKNKKEIILAVKELSKKIGKEHVFLRYDPILINGKYTIEYHTIMFERLCKQLDGYINRIIISFIDLKKNTLHHESELKLDNLDESKIKQFAANIGAIAKQYGIIVQTCAEPYDLSAYGIRQEGCRSANIMYELIGSVTGLKSGNSREGCTCMASVDIGSYNSCSLFCKYCYANYDEKNVLKHKAQHSPNSTMLIGELEVGDVVTERYK